MAILSKLGANLAAFFDGLFTLSTATKVTGVVFGGLTVIYIGKVWWSYRFFKRLGLKTPKYRFFYGNLNEVIEKGYSTVFQEWTAQLGKTYGFYEGHYPVLVTSDLDLIQEIFIKKYAYFSTRKMSPHISSDNDPSLDLFTSGGERWKRFRTIMNPTFTSTKVKELIPIMDNCSKRLLDIIENHVNEEITISDYFDRLTMDTIFNCAFGIDIEPQKNIDNIFLTSGIAHFRERAKFNFTMIIIYLFHEFKPYINAINRKIPIWFGGLSKALVPSIFQLYTHIHKVLDERIRKKILIDSCSSDFEDKTQNEYAEFNKMRIQKALSPPEIINHLVLFLLTGFETTASALSYSIYELTKHPDEMHKLQEEIDSFYPPDSDFQPDVESINKLTYLDMFFKEVLRMHPVANGAITRRCVEPITIQNINFPRGLALTVDVLSLHYNEEYWENPYEFNPSRFEPEKDKDINPLVYMPFGIGPRTCIGMRFAQTEVKLLMVKLLRKYDVLATAKTPEKMSYSEGIVRRPKFGVSALFRPRNY